MQDRSPSSSLYRPRPSLAFEGGPGGIGVSSANGAVQTASGASDPFSELLNRLATEPQPQQQPGLAPAQDVLASAKPLEAQAASGAEATAAAPAAAGTAPVAGSSSGDLADVAEAQCQLREEVGSLAIQLHAAIADLSEQVAALRQVQAEHQHLHDVSPAAMAVTGSSTASAAAAEAPAVQAESSTPHTPPACSGVLHAPLSLVVQLQQELSGMKAESISKEQFVAVVRMVKELRSQSCSSEVSSPMARSSSITAAASRFAAAVLSAQPSSASVLDTATGDGPSAADTSAAASGGPSSRESSTDKVSQVLQQHSEQLAAVESSLEALMHKAESAETIAASQQPQVQELQQQQADLQQQQLELSSALGQQQAELQAHTSQIAAQTQELTSSISKAQADVQQQDTALAQLATVLASVSVTQNEVKGLSHQQSSLQADLSKVSAYVDELASKLHSAANAAALAVARPHSSSTLEAPAAGSGGFSEMVAGLANLKSCLDQQASAVADLSTRLQDQEAVLQGLIEGAAAAGSSNQGSSAEGGNVSKAEVQELASQLAAVQQKLAVLEQQQGVTGSLPAQAAVPAASTAPAASSTDSAAQAGGAAAETDAAAEPDADGQPLGFMHGMLVDLKKRIDKLEADSVEAKATAVTVAALTAASSAASSPAQQASPAAGSTAAAVPATATPAASSTPATPTHKGLAGLSARKGAAWAGHRAQNAAASMEELQEWLACLQGEITRLDATDASLMATLESLRGDVGAAAAAAAAAAIAAKLTAAGSPTSASAAPGSGSKISTAQAQSATQTATDSNSGLWVAVEELRAQLSKLQEEDFTAQAAAWAAGECGTDRSSSSRKVDAAESALDVDQLKLQLLADVGAMQASWQASAAAQLEAVTAAPPPEAEREAAVTFLNTRVIELQDTLTEVAAQAAAAAALAAAAKAGVQSAAVVNNSAVSEERLLGLQAQLDSFREPVAVMQQQMQQLLARLATSVTAPQLPPTAHVGPAINTPVYTATPGSDSSYFTPGDESFFTPNSDEAAQQSPAAGEPKEGPGPIQKCLSFGDLARSSGGGTPAAAAAAAATPETAFEPEFGTPTGSSTAAAGEQQGVAAASPGSAVPSRKVSDADSRDLSRASSTSSRSSSKSGKLSGRQLLEDMSALPAAKQVAIVSKLAGLVSSHATRLLATYHEDPDLSAQLQTVQQQLSAAVQSAATGSASRRSDGKDNSSSPPSRHVARSASTGTAAAAAATGVSNSSSEALLCILDQVASLRAIGSATHPAIAEKLHKHEVQLAQLKEAQQGIMAAISALSGGAEVTQVLSVPAVATAECASPPDSRVSASPAASPATSPAASSDSNPAAAAAAEEGVGADVAQQSGPGYEGELGHRLADVEGRLAAGLKVLSAVRSKLSPLQEVADATQSMMRELQVCVTQLQHSMMSSGVSVCLPSTGCGDEDACC